MSVEIKDCETFEEFLAELRNRPAIRLVKLADYGFVGPLKTSSGATVMAPQVKIVATAVDRDGTALIRWRSARQGSSAATVGIGKATGIHGDVEVVAEKEDLRNWLELEGYSISDGEWRQDDIDRLFATRAGSSRDV